MVTSYEKFTLTEQLTKVQKQFFEEHGFIHFTNFLTQEAIENLVNASKVVEKKWIAEDVKFVNGVPIKYGKNLNGDQIVQRFAFINQHHSIFKELLLDSRINSLKELIGPGARIGGDELDDMVFNHYLNHPNSKFSQMGWHTDGLRELFYGKIKDPMLNVGFHLNNLKPENGGLRILPGTHKQNMWGFLFGKVHLFDNSPDPKEIAIVPKSGDLTVHDGRLWHRVQKSSIAGEESRRRVIYMPIITGKYMPKDENSPTPFYQKLGLV